MGAIATGAAVDLNGGTIFAAANVTLSNGVSNLRQINLAGIGGGLAALNGFTLTVNGQVESSAGAGPLVIGIPASTANGGIAGQVPGTGAGTPNAQELATGTVVLNNTTDNGFYGGVILDTGTLNINGEYALGGSNYGGLSFNGGTLQYTTGLTINYGGGDVSQNTAGVVEPVTFASTAIIDVNGNTVTYANGIGNGGTGGLTVASSSAGGALILTGDNTYAGATTINSGATLQLGNGASGKDGAIATSSGITDNGTLTYDRYGAQSTALAITGSGNVIIEGAGSQTLSASSGYTGSTTVTGTLIVTGSLTATGSVAINGGAADLNAPNSLYHSAHLTLAAGTLATLAGETEALGDLTLGAGASTLSLGATGAVVNFADSSANTWTGTLAITNWNGNAAGGGSDQVIFANDDLSGSQLSDINFVNPTINGVPYVGSYGATELSSGEISPAVPEPDTWGMIIGGAGMLVVWQRSRRHGRGYRQGGARD